MCNSNHPDCGSALDTVNHRHGNLRLPSIHMTATAPKPGPLEARTVESSPVNSDQRPGSINFLPELHGLRGLAALIVLLFHWRTNFPAFGNAASKVEALGHQWNLMFLIDYGWVGVQWFFVLSGYLLGGVLWNKPLNGRNVMDFWQRRFTRIYPGLWFQLLLMSLLTSYTFLLKDLDPLRMLNNALLWLHPMPGGSAPYNGVWWTLPIELGFYLVVPLCLVWYRNTGVWSLLILGFTVSIGWRYGIAQWSASEGLGLDIGTLRQLPGSLSLFLVGMALNHWRNPGRLPLPGLLLCAVALLYLGWLYALSQQPRALSDALWVAYFWEPLMGILIAGIVYLVVQPSVPARWLGCKPLLLMGTWSYGIYLWHFPVLRLLPRTVPGPWKTVEGSLLALLICLVVTTLLAMLSYYLVERPALNAVARWQRRRVPKAGDNSRH